MLAAAGLARIGQLRHVPTEDLIGMLDAGGYARYDLRTATRLLELCGGRPVRRPGRGDRPPLYGLPGAALSRTPSSGSRRSPRPMACYPTRPNAPASMHRDLPDLRGQRGRLSRPGPCSQCAGSGAEAGTAPRPCPDCDGIGQQSAASRRGPVVIRQVTTCPACRGRGHVIVQPCRACDGTGQAVQEDAVQEDKVTIRIPHGVPEGATLRLADRECPAPSPEARRVTHT
jgi:hypothetical protein